MVSYHSSAKWKNILLKVKGYNDVFDVALWFSSSLQLCDFIVIIIKFCQKEMDFTIEYVSSSNSL